jgi:hypothetical protein
MNEFAVRQDEKKLVAGGLDLNQPPPGYEPHEFLLILSTSFQFTANGISWAKG